MLLLGVRCGDRGLGGRLVECGRGWRTAGSVPPAYRRGLDCCGRLGGQLAGLEVAVLEAGEFFAEEAVGFEGGLGGVGELEHDLVESLMVEGPDFEVVRDVVGVGGGDEVDFVGAVGMDAARARVAGELFTRDEFVAGLRGVSHGRVSLIPG